MSHLHFTSTTRARERVISMGEEEWRVHRAGAPSLDHLRRSRLLTREELQEKLGLEINPSAVLVAYHPVTMLRDTAGEADALFSALSRLEGQILFCYPNADSGSHHLIERTQAFLSGRQNGRPPGRGNGRLFVNLDAVTYWSLLRQVAVLVGNSSSGIMETASFALPTVNVGFRQQGRERAKNVLDAAPEAGSIGEQMARAQSSEFRASLAGMANPYGDGYAAEKIVEVLTTAPLGQSLLIKYAGC
jgi:UDP-N-acetylglucosamine 2-epimerase (non-hydrolysing)/GDP/UDP-N,N'-diacetylbacillosamine 2-epimerase (hydrolysing)